MTPDIENDSDDEKPAKPTRFELILIAVFLLFVSWGTFELGLLIVEEGAKGVDAPLTNGADTGKIDLFNSNPPKTP